MHLHHFQYEQGSNPKICSSVLSSLRLKPQLEAEITLRQRFWMDHSHRRRQSARGADRSFLPMQCRKAATIPVSEIIQMQPAWCSRPP